VLLNSSVFGAWEDFLTQELVPFIDTEYRTIPTPRGRAIMGHSSGGYGAIMAATLHPGIWGAVGLNDPAAWAACERDVAAYPAEFGDYPYLRNNAKALVQIGIAIAPNPEVPRRFDVPVPLGSDGEATARAWERYCLLREAGVRAHLDGLNLLSAIEVVAPRRSVWTNRDASRKMVAVMRGHGLPVFLMETPGSHGGARPARFIELARRLRRVIDPGFPDATRTAALTWGGVKGDAAR
jgi:pimeloyl-ACP methyl ester carboxylesterase